VTFLPCASPFPLLIICVFSALSGGLGLSSRPLSPADYIIPQHHLRADPRLSSCLAVPMITIRLAAASSITYHTMIPPYHYYHSPWYPLTTRFFLAWQHCCCPSPVFNAFPSRFGGYAIRTSNAEAYRLTLCQLFPEILLIRICSTTQISHASIHSFLLPHALRTSLYGAAERVRGCGAVRATA